MRFSIVQSYFLMGVCVSVFNDVFTLSLFLSFSQSYVDFFSSSIIHRTWTFKYECRGTRKKRLNEEQMSVNFMLDKTRKIVNIVALIFFSLLKWMLKLIPYHWILTYYTQGIHTATNQLDVFCLKFCFLLIVIMTKIELEMTKFYKLVTRAILFSILQYERNKYEK